MRFTIYRLRDIDENAKLRFRNSKSLEKTGNLPVNPEAYEGIWQASNDGLDHLDVNEALDSIFCLFNTCDREDKRYSMSVGDIVVLDGAFAGAYFCESFGWRSLPDFYKAVHLD